jgi:cellulose synthase/poly-beta-1,6-N-acetylglucosamine synthase-like glycosyltransferase
LFATLAGGISVNQNLYWKYELFLRREESAAGFLATVTGACMAVRRRLFRPLPANSGEDCIVPLDVVEQGYRVVQADAAIAFDEMPATTRGELRARARMTARNLNGIFDRRLLLNPFLYPGYAFSLWSHKILRWLTPLWAVLFVMGSLLAFPKFPGLLDLVGVFAALCLLGAVAEYFEVPGFPGSPLISVPFSFFLANLGFLKGLVRFLTSRDIVIYRNAP